MSSLGFDSGLALSQRRLSAGGGPVAPVPANYDVTFFGDSRAAFGFDATLDANGYIARLQPIGVAGWMGPVSGHKLRVARNANFGENGNTSAQMVASPRLNGSGTTNPATWFRRNSLAAGNAADITASAPGQKSLAAAAAHPAGIVAILAGTNDGVGTFATTSQANILTMIAALTGKVVLLYNELPRGVDKAGVAGFTVTNAVERKAFSDWIKTLDYASGHANAKSNVIVIDSWAEFVDPASGTAYLNKVGYHWDGIHPSQFGARRLAQITVDRLSSIWGAWAGLPPQIAKPTTHGLTTAGAQQPYVNSNPVFFAGTNGTVAGTWAAAPAAANVAQGWEIVATVNASGLTGVASKTGTDPDGFTTQDLTLTGTVAAAQIAQIEVRQRLANQAAVDAEVAAGRLAFTDKLRAFGSVFVPAGSTNIYFPSLELFIQEATGTKRLTARVHAAQRSMFRDVDGLDNGGVWYDLMTEVLDLAEPNMTAAPGNVSVVSSIVIKWNIYLGNDTAAGVQTINTNGPLRFSRTGFVRVAS
jgi:lysophospholipase L1-like esterase